MLPQNNKEENNYDSDEDTDEEELELAYKKVIDMLSHSIEYKNPFQYINKPIKIKRKRKNKN